jgi:hypothetical protein
MLGGASKRSRSTTSASASRLLLSPLLDGGSQVGKAIIVLASWLVTSSRPYTHAHDEALYCFVITPRRNSRHKRSIIIYSGMV